MTDTAKTATLGAGPSGGTWGAWRNRWFRGLWIANVVSGIGSTMHDTAAVWTMTSLTSSAQLVTLMTAMSSLPLFLLALPAGALADIVDRRRVLLVAQGLAMAVTVALALLASGGHLTPLVLLVATAALGVCGAFTAPTWQALMAEIVDRRDLAGAVTLGSVGVNVARALGPVAGGVLVASAGVGAVFWVNAASFLGILWMLGRTPTKRVALTGQAESLGGAMIAAWRFTRHSPGVQAVMVRTAAFAVLGVATMALLPVLVRSRGLLAADFGFWMGAYGAGGIVAAFLVLPALRRRWPSYAIVRGGMAAFAMATALVATLEAPWVVAAALFLAGAAWLTTISTLTVAGQALFPSWVRARSSAIALLVLQGSLALGAMAWGWIAGHVGVPVALGAAGAALGAVVVVETLFARRLGEAPDLSASPHWAEHQLAHEPAADDGPVLVTLDYEVAPEDRAAFIAAAAALRHVRLRDGAFRWTLLRRLEVENVYRESFYVGSWGEHLRQHARATAADRAVEAAVVRFHRGPGEPVAAHFLGQGPVTSSAAPSP